MITVKFTASGKYTQTCPQCRKVYEPTLTTNKAGMRSLIEDGLLIQAAFPNATTMEREQLMTGLCSDKCWDAFVPRELT